MHGIATDNGQGVPLAAIWTRRVRQLAIVYLPPAMPKALPLAQLPPAGLRREHPLDTVVKSTGWVVAMGSRKMVPVAGGLSRRQAARLLGMTVAEVAKLDGTRLHPVQETDRSWRYHADEVRAFLRDTTPTAPVDPNGLVSAAVFELFEKGRAMPQVVIATRQTASVVQRLRGEYDAMVGSLLLPAPAVSELAGLLDLHAAPTSDELVTAIRAALAAHHDRGYEEGRREAGGEDFGEVIDPNTGQARRVVPQTAGSGPGPNATPSRGGTAS
jgi:hypothetical protein